MKKKQVYGIAIGVLFSLSLLFTGCKNEFYSMSSPTEENASIEVTTSVSLEIPFASEAELEKASTEDCYTNEGFLDYRVARDYAFAEFYAQVETLYPECILSDLGYPDISGSKDKLSFSDKPVIVYDYEDKPYYYEYAILFDQETIVGTVVASAQPNSDELIEYLFPYPIQYENNSFRSMGHFAGWKKGTMSL